MWLRDFPLGKGTFGSGYVRLTAIAKWKDTVRKYLQLEREKKKKKALDVIKQNTHTHPNLMKTFF